jgi:hypothetical protein
VRLSVPTLLLSCVVVCTALLAFEGAGAALALGLLGVAVYIRTVRFMSRTAISVWGVFAGLFFAGCAIALGVQLSSVRYLTPGVTCMNNLNASAIGLEGYRQKNGTFPPASTADADGKPMHSWRTLILPYVENQGLYEQYNQKEPWDGPNNSKLPPPGTMYVCPRHPDSPMMTSYFAVVGPNTVWEEKTRGKQSARAERAIMLVEMANSGIRWTEPRDLAVEEAVRAIQAGPHWRDRGYFCYDQPGVTFVALGNGWVKALPARTPRETLEALLTINGKEDPPDIDKVIESLGPKPPPKLRWDRIALVSLLAVSYALLLLRPIRHRLAQEPLN